MSPDFQENKLVICPRILRPYARIYGFNSARFKALLCTSAAMCTGFFLLPEFWLILPAVHRNCISNPYRCAASLIFMPIRDSAAFHVAPHGAPFFTRIQSIWFPERVVCNSGIPNRSPYLPRQSSLGVKHQTGGAITVSMGEFLPDAISGMS